MVGDARFVNVSLLVRKLGEIGISIVPNISAGSVFQKYGSNARALKYTRKAQSYVPNRVTVV